MTLISHQVYCFKTQIYLFLFFCFISLLRTRTDGVTLSQPNFNNLSIPQIVKLKLANLHLLKERFKSSRSESDYIDLKNLNSNLNNQQNEKLEKNYKNTTVNKNESSAIDTILNDQKNGSTHHSFKDIKINKNYNDDTITNQKILIEKFLEKNTHEIVLSKLFTPILAHEARGNFWTKILPNSETLQKISTLRESLEPNLKNFLTTKYNTFLSNLVPYSNSIGVAPFILNSMKIPENFDPRFKGLESLKNLLSSTQSIVGSRSLNSIGNDQKEDKIERKDTVPATALKLTSGDEFISDQEPHATWRGRKKYRIPTSLKIKNMKMDGVYENGQYIPHGDSYSEPSEHYSTKNTFDRINHNDEGYGGGHSKGKYFPDSGYGEAFGAGHNHYSTKGHGHSHSHSHGYGGGGMAGYLDPFSILGGLAFLTYLGLLFQLSINGTAAGREFEFSRALERPLVKEYNLNLNGMISKYKRNKKSLDSDVPQENMENSLELGAGEIEFLWDQLKSASSSQDINCRLLRNCQVFKQLNSVNLLDTFEEGAMILTSTDEDVKKVRELAALIKSKKKFKCYNIYKCKKPFIN